MKLAFTTLIISASFSFAAQAASTSLSEYQKVPGITGSLTSVGSDTLAGMTTLWVDCLLYTSELPTMRLV